MRYLLILLIGISCTGCYSLRNDSPLLLHNRLSKGKNKELAEYELFDQYDADHSDDNLRVGTGIVETDSKAPSTEAGKQQSQTERILDLIEQTDDALLRRILAEKLLQDERAAETPVVEMSSKKRSSAEHTANAQVESPSFGAQFAEVPAIERAAISGPKLVSVELAGVAPAQEIQESEVHYESMRQANSEEAIDPESAAPFASHNEPAKLSTSLLAGRPEKGPESIVESKHARASFVRPASMILDVPATANPSLSANTDPESWKDELELTIALLESSLNADGLANDEQAMRKVYLRLLHLIGSNGQQAPQSFAELDADDQRFWLSQMQALTSLLETKNGEAPSSIHGSPNTATQQAVEHLRQAIHRLSNETELQVRNVALCREVLGYGQYESFGTYEFPAGQNVLIYCELENFVTSHVQTSEGKLFESEFKGGCTILNEKQRVVHRHQYSKVRDQGRRPRRDFYMYFPLSIPELPPGNYSLRLEVEDLKGNKVGTSHETVSFVVR